MRPPLTKNKYGIIDKSIPVTTADKTKTNATGYALKQVPKKVQGKDWLDTLDDVMSAPQKAATYAIEAGLHKAGVRKDPPKYESPSDGLGISEKDHPWIKMGTDMLLDPTNLLGIGIGKKIVSTYKDLKYLDKTDNVIKSLTKVEGDGFDVHQLEEISDGENSYLGSSQVRKLDDIDLNSYSKEFIKDGKKYRNLKDFQHVNFDPRIHAEHLTTVSDILIPVDKTVRKGQKAGTGTAVINDLINQKTNTEQNNSSTTKTNVAPKQTFNKVIKEIPKTNFEQRIQNPVKQINNPDSTHSTHKMMSFEADGKYYAAPTIVQKGDSLVELSQKDAIDYAFKNKELKEFKTEKESQDYAKGSYKVNTPLEQPKKDIGKPETYWLGDKWGSYNDLIQSNPRMKDPNLFYNTYKRKAPIDSTGTKTNLVIPKYKEGGLIKPYVTSDLKDFNKRTQQYNDSLNLYNLGNARAKIFDVNPLNPELEKYNKDADKIVKRTGIKPTIARSSMYGDLPYPKGDITWQEPWIAKFKKPTQKIEYIKPLDEISKMTPIELSSLPNNTTSEPQKRVVEPIKTINKGYMDMRGQWLDNPATSFDYTPEQLEKMGYRKSTPKMKLGGEVPKYKQGGEIKNSWLDTYEDGGPVTENQIQPQPLDSTTYENNIKNNSSKQKINTSNNLLSNR